MIAEDHRSPTLRSLFHHLRGIRTSRCAAAALTLGLALAAAGCDESTATRARLTVDVSSLLSSSPQALLPRSRLPISHLRLVMTQNDASQTSDTTNIVIDEQQVTATDAAAGSQTTTIQTIADPVASDATPATPRPRITFDDTVTPSATQAAFTVDVPAGVHNLSLFASDGAAPDQINYKAELFDQKLEPFSDAAATFTLVPAGTVKIELLLSNRDAKLLGGVTKTVACMGSFRSVPTGPTATSTETLVPLAVSGFDQRSDDAPFVRLYGRNQIHLPIGEYVFDCSVPDGNGGRAYFVQNQAVSVSHGTTELVTLTADIPRRIQLPPTDSDTAASAVAYFAVKPYAGFSGSETVKYNLNNGVPSGLFVRPMRADGVALTTYTGQIKLVFSRVSVGTGAPPPIIVDSAEKLPTFASAIVPTGLSAAPSYTFDFKDQAQLMIPLTSSTNALVLASVVLIENGTSVSGVSGATLFHFASNTLLSGGCRPGVPTSLAQIVPIFIAEPLRVVAGVPQPSSTLTALLASNTLGTAVPSPFCVLPAVPSTVSGRIAVGFSSIASESSVNFASPLTNGVSTFATLGISGVAVDAAAFSAGPLFGYQAVSLSPAAVSAQITQTVAHAYVVDALGSSTEKSSHTLNILRSAAR